MKKNNVAKRLGIASLCLAVAISALGGIITIGNDVAFAEEEVLATDVVETTTSKENVTQSTNGLLLSSDVAYEATFKTLFTESTTLNFKFPEKYTDVDDDKLPDSYHGNFKFTITDATDESKSFDVVYYTACFYINTTPYYYTGTYVQYGSEKRTGSSKGDDTWFNYVENKNYMFSHQSFAPSFLRYSGNNKDKLYDGEQMGSLKLVWTDDVLAVQALAVDQQKWYTRTIAAFDGTESFVSGESWGLPKINFENGYTIRFSSDFTADGAEDHGTDVLFTSIMTNDEETYVFKQKTFLKDNFMKAYDTLSKNDVFLGWKHIQKNTLYPTYAQVKDEFDRYEPLVIDFATSCDASAGRFQTLFNEEQYLAITNAGYIRKMGTLVALTNHLAANVDFTIENYQDQISNSDGYVKKVESEEVYAYTDKMTGNAYKAYALSIVDLADANGEASFSARGYIVVRYKGGDTRTIYTDFDVKFNSISASVAIG